MKRFDESFYQELIAEAKLSPRLRANANIHDGYDDVVQRLYIAMEPNSYVRPHRHIEAHKWEFFFVARGCLAFFVFEDDGTLRERIDLSPKGVCQSIEIPPNTWHSTISLESGTVFFEVKQGPYTPLDDKGFAQWSPVEGEAGCAPFMSKLLQLKPGERIE